MKIKEKAGISFIWFQRKVQRGKSITKRIQQLSSSEWAVNISRSSEYASKTHTLKQINMPGTQKKYTDSSEGSGYRNLWLVTEKTSDGDVQTELVHQGQGIRLKSALGLLPLQRIRPLHGS